MSFPSKTSIIPIVLLAITCKITLAAEVFSFSLLDLPMQVRMDHPWYQVINSQQEWATFFDNNIGNLYSNVSDYRTLTDVDFNNYTLIIGGLGARTGSELMINTVSYSADNVLVRATEIQPGPTCNVAQVITFPTRAFLIRKTSQTINIYLDRDYFLCNQ